MAITSTSISSTSPETVFTASSQTVISTMYLCNYSAANVTANIFVIAGNSSPAGVTNVIYQDEPITISDTLILDTEKLILDSSDVIQVQCSNSNSITVTVSSYSI